MRKILLYGHGGSYNHGAEAIIRTTADMLRKYYEPCEIILSTHFKDQDLEFGLPIDRFLIRDCKALTAEKESGNKGYYNTEVYKNTLDAIDKDTICLSVGGDNYCYPNWAKWKVIHDKALEVGAKSILWSCSIETDMIDDDMLKVLKTHHLITTRESMTYNALLDKGINNAKLVSDVAFLLKAEEVELPNNFIKQNTIAINISPLTARKENTKDILKYNVLELIKYIIKHTDMAIVLIPHVTMPMDNDFTYLNEVYSELEDQSRISLIGINYNAQQLKYIISQCRFGIFARTHASIAAYSSCIPTIAIGYSVKAQGIAKDLNMSGYILDINKISKQNDILDMFKKLYNNEEKIRLNLGNHNNKLKQQAINNFEYLKEVIE